HARLRAGLAASRGARLRCDVRLHGGPCDAGPRRAEIECDGADRGSRRQLAGLRFRADHGSSSMNPSMNPNMSVTAPEVLQEERRARRFTLISVALNLFFVAIAATWFARSYFSPPAVVTVTIDRGASARIERIAETLPPADAAIMRAAYRDNAAMLDA